MINPTPSATDKARIVALLAEIESAGKADHDRRDQALDRLQDLVGLAGKMVMEADILRRAERIAAGG